MTDGGFTVPEFIELLASSLFGGALTGTVVIHLYLRFRKRKFRRQQLHDEERNGAEENNDFPRRGLDPVLIIEAIRNRHTPSIPIQDPPEEESTPPLSHGSDIAQWSQTRIYPEAAGHDRELSGLPIASTPLVAATPSASSSLSRSGPLASSDHRHTYPPNRPTSLTPTPTSQYSTSPTSRAADISPRVAMSNHSDGGGNSTADASLSRTTTNVSTLPPYDTLSSGPPRYSTRSRTPSLPPTSAITSHPSPVRFYPPMPDPWWTKQDGSEMF